MNLIAKNLHQVFVYPVSLKSVVNIPANDSTNIELTSLSIDVDPSVIVGGFTTRHSAYISANRDNSTTILIRNVSTTQLTIPEGETIMLLVSSDMYNN